MTTGRSFAGHAFGGQDDRRKDGQHPPGAGSAEVEPLTKDLTRGMEIKVRGISDRGDGGRPVCRSNADVWRPDRGPAGQVAATGLGRTRTRQQTAPQDCRHGGRANAGRGRRSAIRTLPVFRRHRFENGILRGVEEHVYAGSPSRRPVGPDDRIEGSESAPHRQVRAERPAPCPPSGLKLSQAVPERSAR